MVSGRVLRIPRTDDNDSFVLARVEQTGSSVLDLRLTGTDGVEAFVGQIRQNGITKLQSKNYHGTSREWTATLSAILLKQKDAVSEVKDVEIVAALEARRIILVIRKNIDGITQRLGSITMERDDETELSLFDWTGLAISTSDGMIGEMNALQTSIKSQQEVVAKLNSQLDDLIRAKKEHEDELLQKFAELLNAKKLKIRDQQRLLASAKIDPQAAAQVHATRSNGHKPSRSAPGKRKVKDQMNSSESEDSDLEAPVAALEADDRLNQESDREETENEDDEGDVAGFDPAVSQPLRGATDHRSQTTTEVRPDDPDLELPPRRELPFEMKKTFDPTKSAPLASVPAPARQAVDDDDETDDDEL